MKSESKLTAIILAAGKGTRMRSPLPKVLHPICGAPMLSYAIEAAKVAGAHEVRVVAGYGYDLVAPVCDSLSAKVYRQVDQLGTADAVKSALTVDLEGTVIIMNGDHPLLDGQDLQILLEEFEKNKLDLALVSCHLKNPKSFGRIIRNENKLTAIIEASDASPDQLKLTEVNTGIYIVKSHLLRSGISEIKNENSKKEFYLTDLIHIGINKKWKMDALVGNSRLAWGVNSQSELAVATKYYFKKSAQMHLDNGVIILAPEAVYIEPTVKIGSGSVIYPNVYLKGNTTLGRFAVIESNVFITDSIVGDSTQVRASSYLEQAVVGSKCTVGPMARLRPKAQLEDDVHIGNFVEIKNSNMASGSKAGHLTYLGDADIGSDVNIGCGTITCNYSPEKKKFRTKIGSRVFVGSDTQFVAPVTIGDDSIVASGSTITEDVPAFALAIARGRQVNKLNYKK